MLKAMRILAVDYGESRTGLAISDYTGTIATPLTVIHEKNFNALIKKIAIAAEENDATEIVVGNPINMNGSKGEKSIKCELLAEKLRSCVSLPVEMWDERLTTVAAHDIISENNPRSESRNKRRQTIDAIAAAVILEGYLGYKGNRVGIKSD